MPKEYIDRDAAFRAILGQPPDAHYPGWYAASIKEIPAADVATVVHGEWEPYQPPNESRQVGWICTNCSSVIRDLSNGDTDFCPHCGAKMDGGGQGRFADIGKTYSEIKAEAIREFAERLKNKFYSYYEGLDENTSKSKYNGETLMYYEVADMIENCIDNTVKEMTEEQNEP